MSTTRQIAHNTGIQLVGKVVSVTLGLVALGMMTRYLGTEQFGWYTIAITFLQFIGIFIDLGMVPVTAQMLSEPGVDQEKLLKNLLGFRFATAAFFLSLAPVLALFFPYPFEVKIAIAILSLSFFSIAMNQIFIGYFQTKLQMYIQVVGEVVGRIALVAGLFFLIRYGSSFLPIMGVITFSGVLYSLVLWRNMHKNGHFGLRYDMPVWKNIFTKSWPIGVAIIFNVAYLKGDTLLLSFYRSESEVGIYGAAYRVIDVLAQNGMMVMGIFLPLLSAAWTRNLSDEFRVRYQQAFDIVMCMGIPMVLGTFYLANPIMLFIAGPKFTLSGDILKILSLAVFGVYLGVVFGHTAVAIGKQRLSLWIYASNAILTVTGYLIFIPRYGLAGAAWMTVFSEIYAGILLFLLVRRYSKQRLELKTLAKTLVAGGAMIGVLSLLPSLHVTLLVLIGGATYLTVLLATRAISQKTLKEITSLRP